ncbi:MAG: cytochrome C oxidase Cbb3 [Desulfuromonas sp.]|nr:MAG: cytochrome C oxidase Cbb3 [Desulfuromonas sp.]
MKRLLLLTAVVMLGALHVSQAEAASAIKGKSLYQEICQKCHTQGGDGGVMVPSDKKKSEWEDFFNGDQHGGDPEMWEKLTRKKKKDLLLFFINYAIDSEKPDECG